MMKSLVVPYIMDLGSTNGTYLNVSNFAPAFPSLKSILNLDT